jgi:hypothetical protein
MVPWEPDACQSGRAATQLNVGDSLRLGRFALVATPLVSTDGSTLALEVSAGLDAFDAVTCLRSADFFEGPWGATLSGAADFGRAPGPAVGWRGGDGFLGSLTARFARPGLAAAVKMLFAGAAFSDSAPPAFFAAPMASSVALAITCGKASAFGS